MTQSKDHHFYRAIREFQEAMLQLQGAIIAVNAKVVALQDAFFRVADTSKHEN